MGLPWIQVTKEFPRSQEAIALGHELGVGRAAAVGMCVEFWAWAADQAPDGRVDGALAALVIDEAMGRPGFTDAMVKVGLLEREGSGLRVVGWERYAKTLEKASRDASRKRARRGNGAETARAAPPDGSADGAGKRQSQRQSQKSPTETESPPPEKHVAGIATPIPPTTPPEQWNATDFWAWAQDRRIASGLLPEKLPRLDKLNGWFSSARMVPGVTTPALKEGFYKFGDDKHWGSVDPPYPFAGFMSQWERFTRPEGSHGVAA